MLGVYNEAAACMLQNMCCTDRNNPWLYCMYFALAADYASGMSTVIPCTFNDEHTQK